MDEVAVLEWAYSPQDYFEELISIKGEQYEMKIDGGKVEARMKAEVYDQNQNIRDALNETLNGRFLGNQLLTHKPYQLSKPSMYKLHPNGQKDYHEFGEPAVIVMSVGSSDILVTDKDGKVVVDTRKDRIEKKKNLSELVEKYRATNSIVAALVGSYHAAVMDPDNELVHLYEIRDALTVQFGGGDAVRNTLSINRDEWSRFGYIADKAPVKQGRHRGRNVGVLRDATEAELSEARTFSRKLIENYISYLASQPGNS